MFTRKVLFMQLDIERLRKDLKNYYGSAMHSGFPMAMMNLSEIERESDQELIQIAQQNHINLNNYIIHR